MTTIDIIIIGIFAFYMLFGYIKGFIRSIFSLLGGIVSFLIASIGSRILAPIITDTFIMPIFGKTLRDTVEQNAGISEYSDKITELFNSLSDNVLGLLDKIGVSTAEQLTNLENPLDTVLDALVRSVAESISSVICFIALFIITSVVINILSSSLSFVVKALNLSSLNKIAGLALGAITAFIITAGILIAIDMLPDEYLENSSILSKNSLENSLIAPEIYKITDNILK